MCTVENLALTATSVTFRNGAQQILLLHVTYYMLHVTRYMLHITYYMLHITCYILHVTYYMLHVTCYILHVRISNCNQTWKFGRNVKQ
jgi:hypothetical protein